MSVFVFKLVFNSCNSLSLASRSKIGQLAFNLAFKFGVHFGVSKIGVQFAVRVHFLAFNLVSICEVAGDR